jgi:hypothetical protein
MKTLTKQRNYARLSDQMEDGRSETPITVMPSSGEVKPKRTDIPQGHYKMPREYYE